MNQSDYKILPNVFSVCCSAEVVSALEPSKSFKYYCTCCYNTLKTVSEKPIELKFLVELSHIPSKCCNSNVLVFDHGAYSTKRYHSFGVVEVRNKERSRLHICKACNDLLIERKTN